MIRWLRDRLLLALCQDHDDGRGVVSAMRWTCTRGRRRTLSRRAREGDEGPAQGRGICDHAGIDQRHGARCHEEPARYVCFVCRHLGARRERAAAAPVEVADATQKPVHICLWSSQPDLLLACDHSWATPKWGGAATGMPDVYYTDDGRLYTFDEVNTTCVHCLETLTDPVKREKAGTP